MHVTKDPQVWVMAICTLAVYSYLYKENPFWRLAEYSLVALYTSYSVAYLWHNYLIPRTKTYIIERHQYYYIVFGLLGLLYYFRYLPGKVQWLARYPIALEVGWGLGAVIAVSPRSPMQQLADSMRPLKSVNDVIFLLLLLAAFMYFFFTVGKKSTVVSVGGKIGRLVLMVAFGAAFGNTIQGRISLFLQRLSFLLSNWLGIPIG